MGARTSRLCGSPTGSPPTPPPFSATASSGSSASNASVRGSGISQTTTRTIGATTSATLGSRALGATTSAALGLRQANLTSQDAEGFHDFVLPCGLTQEEVIALLYGDISPDDFEKLCKLDERIPKKNIAKRGVVEQLPRVFARECNSSECGVCLVKLEPTQRVVQLPCKHGFHAACISKWLTQCKNTCPMCMKVIDSDLAGNTQGPTPLPTKRSSLAHSLQLRA